MARQATEPAAARTKAAARFHGCVVLQQVAFRRRELENREHLVRPDAGPEVRKILSRLQHARIAALMAHYADLFGQAWPKPGGVNNRAGLSGLLDVRTAGSVAVLARDRQLEDWWITIKTVAVGNRLRAATVAGNATRRYDAAEAEIARFISRRKLPLPRLRIVRKWRLAQVITAAHDEAVAVYTRADRVLEPVQVVEDFLRAIQGILALIKIAAVAIDAKAALNARLVQFGRHGQGDLGRPLHRPPHGGARVASIYRAMAPGARERTHVGRFLGICGDTLEQSNCRGTVEN